jgi:small redox-active disulfide protein 2
MITVKILGSGCANCQKLERETRTALDSAGIPFELTKVTDYADIAAYSVMNTPALVINEAVVSSGKIPKHDQIVNWARERDSK